MLYTIGLPSVLQWVQDGNHRSTQATLYLGTTRNKTIPKAEYIELLETSVSVSPSTGLAIVFKRPESNDLLPMWRRHWPNTSEITVNLAGYMGITPQQSLGVEVEIAFWDPIVM